MNYNSFKDIDEEHVMSHNIEFKIYDNADEAVE